MRWVIAASIVLAALSCSTLAVADDTPPRLAPDQMMRLDWQAYWPREAFAKRIGGHVELTCVVTVKGRLCDCRIVRESPPNMSFGEAALSISRELRYEPAAHDGTSIESRRTIPIDFAGPEHGDPALGSRAHVFYAKPPPAVGESAEPGFSDADRKAGDAYGQGDFASAFQILKAAADGGEAYAQSKLGGLYEEGAGIPQDISLAARLYRASADVGIAEAQFRLGRLYCEGLGVDQDIAQCRDWMRKAGAQGYAPANAWLVDDRGSNGGDDAHALGYRADGEATRHAYDQATDDFAKAIAEGSSDGPAFLSSLRSRRALADRGASRLDEALTDYARAVALTPHAAASYIGRARLLGDAGRHAEALTEALAASRFAVPDSDQYVAAKDVLGKVYESLARPEEAAAAYRAALRSDPQKRAGLDGLRRLGVKPPRPTDAQTLPEPSTIPPSLVW
jgi:TonB family protein